MTKDAYSKLRLELVKEYARLYKMWRAKKSRARNNGEEFTEKPPPKPLLKRVKAIRGKDKAQRLADAYQKKWDRIQKAREARAR